MLAQTFVLLICNSLAIEVSFFYFIMHADKILFAAVNSVLTNCFLQFSVK